jgi:hypothetical protein
MYSYPWHSRFFEGYRLAGVHHVKGSSNIIDLFAVERIELHVPKAVRLPATTGDPDRSDPVWNKVELFPR